MSIRVLSLGIVTFATDHTKFGRTESHPGLIPATIGSYVIVRLGEGKARQVFMSARIFDATEAQNLEDISEWGDFKEIYTVFFVSGQFPARAACWGHNPRAWCES